MQYFYKTQTIQAVPRVTHYTVRIPPRNSSQAVQKCTTFTLVSRYAGAYCPLKPPVYTATAAHTEPLPGGAGMADEAHIMSRKIKNKQLKIWCDDEDYALLVYKARNAGMSNSEFVRTLLYHGSIEYRINYSSEDAQKLLAEFCRISNAVSKIAYIAKLNLTVDEGVYLQLESCFKELFDVIGNHITD